MNKTKEVHYVFDLQGKVLEEIDVTNSETISSVFLKSRHLARVSGDETLYYGPDHQGTTVLVTDETGNKVWEGESSPFGDNVTMDSERDDLDFLYTGKSYDEDTDLYYFNARFYDASAGRFITEDPARDSNLWYAYCSNNPLKYIDPTGMYIVKSTNQYSYYMQSAGPDITYGHNDETLYESGCAVTMMAKAMSAIKQRAITPQDLAKEKSFFKGGDIDWNAAASGDGLKAQKYSTKDYSYEDIKGMVERAASSAKGFAFGVELEFGSGSHFVNSRGTKMIGGKEYVEIDPTSINDVESAGKGSRAGWKRLNGKLYVPVEKVKSVIVVSEDEKNKPEDPETPVPERDGGDRERDPYRNGMNDEPNEDPEVKRDGHGNPSGL